MFMLVVWVQRTFVFWNQPDKIGGVG